jgi:putative phosphonate catabolism associated alcohol dehydrogenase
MPLHSQVAVFHGQQAPFELTHIAVPTLQKGEVLVRNECTALCKSDLHTYTGKRQEKTPTILGHEIVGRIVAFGEDAPQIDQRGQPLALNDRISWAIFSSDPTSDLAQKGIPQKGDKLLKYGHELLTKTHTLHGGLSDYTIVRANTPIVKIAENVPVKVASIVNCSVATIAGALRLAGEVAGKNVLISGAGMLGLVACAMCQTAGATNIIALDIDPTRLALARQFGANAVFDARDSWQMKLKSERINYEIIIETSGMADAMEQTLAELAIGGTAVWVGAVMPQRPLQIDAEKVVRRLHTLKGLHNYNLEDLKTAVSFIEQHHQHYPFAENILDHFGLNEVQEAFAFAADTQPLRVAITVST